MCDRLAWLGKASIGTAASVRPSDEHCMLRAGLQSERAFPAIPACPCLQLAVLDGPRLPAEM